MHFSEAVAKAAANESMVTSTSPVIPGRVLYADGDALAYVCAGNDECIPARARMNLMDTLAQAQRASGAEVVRIVATSRGSHKGWRYAVASVKPYQGQRESGRRPKNWEYLRNLIEIDPPFPTDLVANAEADDLFAKYSKLHGPDNTVIYTQDKDMQMVPGHHMDWKTMRMWFVPEGTWEVIHNDKVFGRKWFWLQMLQGDTADNVPGLPKYIKPTGKEGLCGPATAAKLLADAADDAHAFMLVSGLYKGYYGDTWDEHLLEQACLLWMRNDPDSRLMNVMADGNPLAHVRELMSPAANTLISRVKAAVL